MTGYVLVNKVAVASAQADSRSEGTECTGKGTGRCELLEIIFVCNLMSKDTDLQLQNYIRKAVLCRDSGA